MQFTQHAACTDGANREVLTMNVNQIPSKPSSDAGDVVAIHPNLDLAASVRLMTTDTARLYLESFYEAKQWAYADFKLPKKEETNSKTSSSSRRKKYADRAVQFDLSGGRVFAAWGERAVIMKLAGIGVKIPPRLTISSPSSVRVQVGETLKLKVSVSDPKAAGATAYELVSGPKHARIAEDVLVWSPTPADVGKHPVEVKAVWGDIVDTRIISVHVALPSVSLGFAARGLAVDREGKFAVCWGPENANLRPSSGSSQGPVKFAVVDLNKKEVVGRQRLNTGGACWRSTTSTSIGFTLPGRFSIA